ncbi:MAG: NUDIX domain-containing protein, partial [Caldilineaceae bacterium]|nr:NUDIX domain-containing protein [Caldilineaceae bacterium]
LAARSKGKEAFYIPGGKREAGESDEEALIREIKEELSIDLVPESIRYLHTFKAQAHGRPEGTMVKMTCYQADYVGEIQIDSEIDELCWIRYGDHEKCSPVVVLILDWLLAQGLIE